VEKKSQEVMFSRKSDEWDTPYEFYDKLNTRYHFTLDPCATEESHKCHKYFTKEDDGLSKSWEGERVFINPPYSKVGDWVKKAYIETRSGNSWVAMLIPARTDTRWWHDYVMNATSIHFVKGRLKFSGAENSAPFPSAVVIFGDFKGRWGSPGPGVFTMGRK